MGDLAADLCELYNLHGDHNLLFRYQNCIIVDGEQKKQWVNLSEWEVLENKLITTENNVDRQLTLADLHLYQKVVPGTLVEEDVSCNSEYMQEIIPIIGQEIREAYHWVPREHLIYFQLDNAGGHGRKGFVEGYTALLRREFNIILRHQTARSPETNALDLGFWMALQNRTEKKSFDKRISNNNVFAAVQEAWDEMPALTLTKIFDRIPKVLDLIVEDNGGNRLVQNNRGLMREPADA